MSLSINISSNATLYKMRILRARQGLTEQDRGAVLCHPDSLHGSFVPPGRSLFGLYAETISGGLSISTFVRSRTSSTSRTLTARSNVMPKYSLRSSRDT